MGLQQNIFEQAKGTYLKVAYLFHVHSGLRGALDVLDAPRARARLGIRLRHLSAVREVRLIANEDHRHRRVRASARVVSALYAQDVLAASAQRKDGVQRIDSLQVGGTRQRYQVKLLVS